MASTEEDVLKEVYYLTNDATKNWRKLLKYGETLDLEVRRKLLWMWPNEKCLWQISKILREFDISCVLSIGCGNGLFEWLLKESLNTQIYGLEVDRQWWCSSYAVKAFMELNYIENMTTTMDKYLQNCCCRDNWNFALMFCYFNNRPAFLEYLKLYKGKCIIIIGPLEKRDVYTDPLPLEPNFPNDMATEWTLRSSLKLDDDNIMVLYEKMQLNI